ncbi:hypothetical protein ACS0TY_007369 [Phlomoides rotata]
MVPLEGTKCERVEWVLFLSGFGESAGFMFFGGVYGSVDARNPNLECKAWHPLPRGKVKIIVDAAFFEDNLEMGIGMVLHDDKGSFIACRCLTMPSIYAVELGEAFGVYEALS